MTIKKGETPVNYTKNLEGIKFIKEIRSIAQTAIKLPQVPSAPKKMIIEGREEKVAQTNSFNATASLSACDRALMKLDIEDAISILNQQLERKPNKNQNYFPLRAIKAIHSLISASTVDSITKSDLLKRLEDSVKKSLLEQSKSSTSKFIFTSPPHVDQTPESKKFQSRLKRLRMRIEEKNYIHLTSNIASAKKQDDITTKSMTYAASVGLNMIVAPLSFGVFMYFFAGQLFSWMFTDEDGDDENNNNVQKVDARKVIVGVISGVIMMFIEMILFVIRSYEFEKSSTKKEKKKGLTPFGDYVKSKAKTS